MSIISCNNKSEYNPDLKLLKLLAGQAMYTNDRLLILGNKVVDEEGGRPRDTLVLFEAQNLLKERNTAFKDYEKIINWSNNTLSKFKKLKECDQNKAKITNFYASTLSQDPDSLTYYKLLNACLNLEQDLLNESLMQLGSSCGWIKMIAHVVKESDTIKLNDSYEFAVVPYYYDYRNAFMDDTCKLLIYKDLTIAPMKTKIIKNGNIFLVTLTPTKKGRYQVKGNFNIMHKQKDFEVGMVFRDSFIVL